MKIDPFFSDNLDVRRAALESCARLADHERFTLASAIAGIAKRAADLLSEAEENAAHATELGRAAVALSILRGEIARTCLLRIAEERSYAVKAALARSLRETRTAEGRSILVYLLSDDDAQADALVAIGAAPWPEVLPALIEIAEADDRAARLAARSIARCGATAGPNEANAAASFLLEQLDDEGVLFAAADAIVRHGSGFTGVTEKARQLASAKPNSAHASNRRVAGFCILAAAGTPLELVKPRPLEEPAHAFLRSLRDDPDPAVRGAAHRASIALGVTS
jgi:hypothetical protein